MSFLLVSLAVVNACVGGPDQLIMKLSGETNAHVSNYSDTNYATEICYDDFFETYTGTNPHTCNGMNTVVNVYSQLNSHASNESDELVYNQQICYGNLQCVFDESEVNDCAMGDEAELIARLFRSYNSHLATDDQMDYPVKLCCANVYWAGLDGRIITEADFGDTIYLVAPNGLEGNFEIKEDDLIINDEIKILEGFTDEVTGNYMAKWTIKKEDLDNTKDFEKFYFEVGVGTQKSTALKINLAINNDPMQVNMNLDCGDAFNKSDIANIIVTATDADDEITGTIKIKKDEEVLNVIDFDNKGVDFNYQFDVSGELQVIAEANNSRGDKSRTISNIMILDLTTDGDYAAACIASPEDYSDFDAITIFFNASTTKGYKVRSGEAFKQIPGIDPFIWNWTFLGDGDQSYTQNWNDLTQGFMKNLTHEFNAIYTSGQKSAKLKVSLP